MEWIAVLDSHTSTVTDMIQILRQLHAGRLSHPGRYQDLERISLGIPEPNTGRSTANFGPLATLKVTDLVQFLRRRGYSRADSL